MRLTAMVETAEKRPPSHPGRYIGLNQTSGKQARQIGIALGPSQLRAPGNHHPMPEKIEHGKTSYARSLGAEIGVRTTNLPKRMGNATRKPIFGWQKLARELPQCHICWIITQIHPSTGAHYEVTGEEKSHLQDLDNKGTW